MWSGRSSAPYGGEAEVKRLLLFDVDGTLIETRGAGRRALRAAMLEVLGEAGMIEGHEFRGKTDPAIVRELLRGAGWDDRRIDAEMPAVWGPYLRELEAALATSELRPSPCPGVRVLLERLSENDRYALGLLTGNVEEGAELNGQITKRCGGLDLAIAFPLLDEGETNLRDFVDSIVECRVCLALNQADGLGRDCDRFDDGVLNGSCP